MSSLALEFLHKLKGFSSKFQLLVLCSPISAVSVLIQKLRFFTWFSPQSTVCSEVMSDALRKEKRLRPGTSRPRTELAIRGDTISQVSQLRLGPLFFFLVQKVILRKSLGKKHLFLGRHSKEKLKDLAGCRQVLLARCAGHGT